MTALQRYAEEVAREVGPEPQGEFGIDPVTIITIIISIITTIFQNCPKPTTAAIRSPSVMQNAVLFKTTIDHCRAGGGGLMLAGRLHRSIKAKGAALPEADAAAIITEASDDSNLLI
jgi:hypothetical protein